MSASSSGNMGLNDANLRFYWEIPLLLSLEIAGKCPSSFRLPLLVHHSWATPTNFQANCASPSPIFHLTAQLHFHTSRPTCHHSPFCRLRPASFVRIRLMDKRHWNLSRKTRQVFRKTSGLLSKSPLVLRETCATKPRTPKENNKSSPTKNKTKSNYKKTHTTFTRIPPHLTSLSSIFQHEATPNRRNFLLSLLLSPSNLCTSDRNRYFCTYFGSEKPWGCARPSPIERYNACLI